MPNQVSSGIDGLDTVLAGGFISGSLTIVQGQPGTGKTILCNQMCFHHARSGGRALYVTLLAENHARMFAHLDSVAFFDRAAIPDQVAYVSAFAMLETEGLHSLLTLLRREVQAYDATVLVLDGLVTMERTAESGLEYKRFIHALQTQASVADCATFLISSASASHADATAEHTMVDCVIDMRSRLYDWRSERDLEVLKRRGAGYLPGRHALDITSAGIGVHPRFEASHAQPRRAVQPGGAKVPSGLPPLDAMFGGGLPEHSMTVLEGSPGSGKTTFGLHFLGPCGAAGPGLLFSTTESPVALLAKARALGLPVAGLIDAGQVSVVWRSSTEGLLDVALHELMGAVRRTGARRLCIDSLTGLLQLAPDPSRLPGVVAALMQELRGLGVTSLFTAEVDGPSQFGVLPTTPEMMHGRLSVVADNILVLRLSRRRSSLVRRMSVFKARDAQIDPRSRSYGIGPGGVAIEELSDAPDAPPPAPHRPADQG